MRGKSNERLRLRLIAGALAAEALLGAVACGLLTARRLSPGAAVHLLPRTIAAPRSPAAALVARRGPEGAFSVVIPELHAGLSQAPNAYRDVLDAAARRRFLPPALVAAVTRVESDFNPREVSEKGAVGLMQVMPETAARFGVRRHELFDPERNAAAGTAYLAWLLDRYHGDLDLTLAAYNAGEGAVDKYGGIPPFGETREYIRRVRARLGERHAHQSE